MNLLTLRRLGLVLACLLPPALKAQLVAPPTFDYISLPSTANLGDTISIGAGGETNLSDDSDGNDWNNAQDLEILRITIDYLPPGGSWTNLTDWLPVWESPASVSTSLNLNQPGTWYFSFQLMDGRPWYSDQYVYGVTVAPPPTPQITSSLSDSANQSQSLSYQISATSSPTSFSASNLPTGLSLDSSTGVISGTVTQTGTISSTISATNAYGTGTATLTWSVTPASIIPAASVNPNTIFLGQNVTLTRNGAANFGVAWTENVIWTPSGTPEILGDMGLGSMSYTPDAGTGTYQYQFRVVDPYYNYVDQWISFTVTSPTVDAPTTLTLTQDGSTFLIISWSGASAQAGIAYYNVYRNGVFVGTTTNPSDPDNEVSPGTTYVYTIQTVDTQGNISPLSASITVTTLPDFELFTPTP